jgi:DnaJ family protein C protein 19
MVRDI